MPPRVRFIEPKQASGEVRKIFDEIEEMRGKGKISSVFQTLAIVPEYLKAQWEYNKANELQKRRKLSLKTKDMISVAVAMALGCKM